MSQGINKLSKPMGAVFFIAMALSFYFMYTYTGPYQWLADLQLRWWESYSEKLTFLITCLLLMGAGAIVVWPFTRLGASGDSGSTHPPLFQRLGQLGNVGGVIALVGIMLAFMAWRDVRRLQGNIDLVDVKVEELEAGHSPSSHYVNLSGVPLVEAKMEFGDSRRLDTYIPVVSETHDGNHGVHAFIKFKYDAPSSVPTHTGVFVARGEIGEGGLPGAVRSQYESIGALTAGQTYYMLEAGTNPAESRDRMQMLLKIGAGILAAGVLMLVIAIARARVSSV